MKDYERFYRMSYGFHCNYVEIIDGERILTKAAEGKTPVDYILDRICNVDSGIEYALAIGHSYDTAIIKVVLNDENFVTLIFFISFFTLMYLCLRRKPAPIIFDRDKRVVYTFWRGRLWLCDWATLSMTTVDEVYRRRGLGLRLYAADGKGGWQPRWFSIATHYYLTELIPLALWDHHMMIGEDRVMSQVAWLLRYMELGPQAVHPVLPFRGPLDYLMPRATPLPVDIADQAQTAIDANGGTAPGDDFFRDVQASSYVKQVLRGKNRFDPEQFIHRMQRGQFYRYHDDRTKPASS